MAMIESPLIQELVAERAHKDILRVLNARLGSVPPEIATALDGIQDDAKLDDLIDWAARCHSLDEFRTHLNP